MIHFAVVSSFDHDLQRFFVDEKGWGGRLLPFSSFVAGGTAGMVSWASIYPVDVVKSRMQNDASSTMMDCVRSLYKEGGVASFFRGFNTSMVRGFVGSGVTFVAVEAALWLSQAIAESRKKLQ